MNNWNIKYYMKFQGKCNVLSLSGYIEDIHCIRIYFVLLEYWSQDSPVSILTGYTLNGQGIWVPFQAGARDLVPTASRLALGSTQPPIQWVLWVFPPGAMQPGCEADHPHSPSAEVKNRCLPLHSPYVFMGWCLIKHRDNFTFTSLL
jgi:hypothetical protein